MGFKTPISGNNNNNNISNNGSNTVKQQQQQQICLPPGVAGVQKYNNNNHHRQKRSTTIIPLVANARAIQNNSNKLQQSTLHKIFGIMLLVVFVMYSILMVCFVYSHHHDESEGKWGPSMSKSNLIRKKFIRQNLQQQEITLQQKRQEEENNNKNIIQQSQQQQQEYQKQADGAIHINNNNAFEEFDIHDMMKPPPLSHSYKDDGRTAIRIIKTKQQQKLVDNNNSSKKQQNILQPNTNTTITITKVSSSSDLIHQNEKPPSMSTADTTQQTRQQQQQQQQQRILTAYLEPINFNEWTMKPLPNRTTAIANNLIKVLYPNVNTKCSKLIEMWPTSSTNTEEKEENYCPPTNNDPFLPWIHDVFPTDDGRYIQFVAQNKRRCNTGTTTSQKQLLEKMQPQLSLFQHVPIKRRVVVYEKQEKDVVVEGNNNGTATTASNRTQQQQQPTGEEEEIRYQLTSHEEADDDGIETRFICKFEPSGIETLSRFNVNYDFAAYRKGQKQTFTKDGHGDNKSIHTSQLIFQCPVPSSLIETIRDGTSVTDDDRPTIFVSLIPIRTPPRYGMPNRFLPPYYQDVITNYKQNFTVSEEYGDNHILPKIEDSGRWENIPICLPTYKAYPDVSSPPKPTTTTTLSDEDSILQQQQQQRKLDVSSHQQKRHRLIAATWASAGYTTRGERFAIMDGQRRLDEWIRFHLLVGVDHIIVYDNSDHHSSTGSSSTTTTNNTTTTTTTTLEAVTNQFPSTKVTRIPWPATVCNNNKSFDDSPGERSSQYAAESSWRLRFGPYTDWMASLDIDEYIVPVGPYKSLKPFLDHLDGNQTKIVSFRSWRSWPRRDMIEPPVMIVNKTICEERLPCFEVHVPTNRSILQTYNCDRQQVKAQHMPAEKQIYRPDYVLQHFVHYSTITRLGQMNQQDTIEFASETSVGGKPQFVYHKRFSPDPLSRFADEQTEVTMLHTKSIATPDTAGWYSRCKGLAQSGTCRIGVPFPLVRNDGLSANATTTTIDNNKTEDEQGWLYNCYVNQIIENYWVPLLDKALKDSQVAQIF